jgi:hypothetical protein
MIRIVLGLPGSGKTLTAVKMIMNNPEHCLTNFHVRRDRLERIKVNDIIKYEENKRGDLKPAGVNWDHWRKLIKQHGNFTIYLDELHNILHSRESSGKRNILMTKWISQIRKVTGESESSDLICMSQEMERVDVALRDLAYHVIHCQKLTFPRSVPTVVYVKGKRMVRDIPKMAIINTHFNGPNAVRRYYLWRETGKKSYDYRSRFIGNNYCQYYDSYELVDFGEGEYL